jgi:hypothetical protein
VHAAPVAANEGFSFLKKRNKKLARPGRGFAYDSNPNEQKFFGSFFQKRTTSLFLPGITPVPASPIRQVQRPCSKSRTTRAINGP